MKRILTSFLIVGVMAGASLAPGCASEAEQKAQVGLDAFKRCDMRAARDSFSEAYTLETRSDFALAYALSDLAVLAEDPSLQPTFKRLGFSADIKTEFLWGQGGILQKLSERTTSCTALEESFRKGFPHPAAQNGGPDFTATIDPTLTVGELRGVLAGIAPRLARIAEALETSAKGTESSFELEGGCGVGKSVIQKPELFAIASALEAFRGGVEALEAYDGELKVKLLLAKGSSEAENRAFVDMMNQHFMRLVKPGAMGASRTTLLRSLDLASRGVDAVSAISATPANALFDWKAFPPGVLADLKSYVGAARGGLEKNELTLVPRVTPELRVNLASFFSDPLDLGKVESPVWKVDSYVPPPATPTLPTQYSVGVVSAPVEKLVAPRFGAGTFDSTRNYEWPALEQLADVNSVTWESVFDPQRRFREGYTCASSSPAPTPSP